MTILLAEEYLWPKPLRSSDLELVRQAVEMPGEMGPQDTRFRDLSYGNQAYLYMRGAREIVGKFIDWKAVVRHVIKGRKAYEIIRPVFRKVATVEIDGQEAEEELLTGFVGSRCMFTLSQTEGPELEPVQTPRWALALALGKLGIREVADEGTDGNRQGYSHGLEFAVSPIAYNRLKTTYHEFAHIVLGHSMPSSHEEYLYHRGVMEAEAEITAVLYMKEVNLLDDATASHSRAYAQHWLDGGEFPEPSARRALKAAGAIIQAGRIALQPEGDYTNCYTTAAVSGRHMAILGDTDNRKVPGKPGTFR